MSGSYDPVNLSDFGGGDIGWWQDYIRSEVDRANDFHADIHQQSEDDLLAKEKELESLRAQVKQLEASTERLGGALNSILNSCAQSDDGATPTEEDFAHAVNVVNETPSESLAEIQAAAIRSVLASFERKFCGDELMHDAFMFLEERANNLRANASTDPDKEGK